MTIPAYVLEDLAKMRPISGEWWSRAQRVIPDGSTSRRRLIPPHPLYASHGVGARLYDLDGNEYIDCVIGFGPHLLGHSHPVVVEALQTAATRGTTYGAPHMDEVRFAELLTEAIPCAGKVNFVNSGSASTAAALRVARALTGKPGLAKFEGGFHGGYDAVLGSFGIDPGKSGSEEDPEFHSVSFGAPKENLVHTHVLPFNHEAAFGKIRRLASELAVVMVEGIQGHAGSIPVDRTFLQDLRRVCSETGVLLMFDEIITGFRLASGGAQEYYGVKADLATYGKVPGGGVPLGIIAGTDEVMAILESTGDPARDLRERAYFGGTFNAGVLVTAVGVAVLHHLREYPEVYDQVNRLGAGMRERLDVVIREADVPAVVVGDGSLFGVRFVEEPVRSVRDLVDENKAASGAMQALLLRRGVFVTPSLGLLSAAHTESDLDEIAEAFQGSFAVLRSVGVFDSA